MPSIFDTMNPELLRGLLQRRAGSNYGRPGMFGNAGMRPGAGGMFGSFGGFPGNAPAAYRPLPQFGSAMRQMPQRAAFPTGAVPPQMPSPTLRQDVISPTLNQERGGYTTERIAQAIREGMAATPGATLEQTARKAVSGYGVSEAQALEAARMAAAGGGGGLYDIGTNYIAPPPDYSARASYTPPPADTTAKKPAEDKTTAEYALAHPGSPEYYAWMFSSGSNIA